MEKMCELCKVEHANYFCERCGSFMCDRCKEIDPTDSDTYICTDCYDKFCKEFAEERGITND